MGEWLSFSDLVKGISNILAGMIGTIIGYFLPIKDMVNFTILLFVIDMILGYWAAKKLRGEKFSPHIIWTKTIPRMLISLLIIILAYMWDDIYHQNSFSTYNTVGWIISGVLIFSIGKNGYAVSKWEVFASLTNLFGKRIKEQTGVDINDLDLK